MKRGQYVHWVKEIRHLFWTATGFFLIHALSYLLMPISTEVSESKNSRLALLITGCTFWISLLVGYTLVVWANAERKAFIKNRLDGDISMHCRMGVITFFANTPAIIVDASLFAGIIALVIIYCIGADRKSVV